MSASLRVLAGSIAVAALAVTAIGCGARVGLLKEAAAADLNCSKSRVHVLGSGKTTRDVEACGQHATYVWEDGDWRMIARSGAVPVAGPQPVMHAAPPPGVAPAQPVPVNALPATHPTGTPSQPPPSLPPPSSASGGKSL